MYRTDTVLDSVQATDEELDGKIEGALVDKI